MAFFVCIAAAGQKIPANPAESLQHSGRVASAMLMPLGEAGGRRAERNLRDSRACARDVLRQLAC
jgi:hypothetical protein